MSKAESTCHTFVFSEVVMIAPFLDNFKMPSIAPYDSKGDLIAYVVVFFFWMDFERVSELARCWAFPLTLTELA